MSLYLEEEAKLTSHFGNSQFDLTFVKSDNQTFVNKIEYTKCLCKIIINKIPPIVYINRH